MSSARWRSWDNGTLLRFVLQRTKDLEDSNAITKGYMLMTVLWRGLQNTRVYLVATNDRDLKRRIREIPGVPIISAADGKYSVERLPDIV